MIMDSSRESFSLAASGIQRSGIRVLFDASSSLEDVMHLEIGQPEFPTPPHIIDAAYRAMRDGYTRYTANAGLLSLREKLAEKLLFDNGIRVTPEDIFVTVGAIGGLHLSITSLVNPGDEILIPDPGYPNYSMIASLCGALPRYYRLEQAGNRFQLDVRGIEKGITDRTRMIIINSPSNPTGMTLGREELESLIALAERHNLYVLSDESYEKVIFDREHVSPASLFGYPKIVSIFSFSKTYSMTGWRVGYLVASKELLGVMNKVQESTVACASSISQKAAEAALSGPQSCVAAFRERYEARRNRVYETLTRNGIEAFFPDGAFYMLIKCASAHGDSIRLAMELLTAYRVAVAPGITFGPSCHPYLRVSLTPDEQHLFRGIDRICQFLSEQN